MKAIIVAAGQGTRLRPYTDAIPKCMVPLAGVPLIERQRAALRHCGIQDITVITGYQDSKISVDGSKLIINPRYETTNMVSSMFHAADLFDGSDDVVVVYGDIVFEPNVLKAVMKCSEPVAVAVDTKWKEYWELRQEKPLDDAETLKLDAGGYIKELGKKPEDYSEIEGQYIGLFKIRSDHTDNMHRIYQALDKQTMYDGKDFDNMYMTSFLQRLINIGWSVKAVPIENGWLEVDTVTDLALYHRLLKEGRLNMFCNLDDIPIEPIS